MSRTDDLRALLARVEAERDEADRRAGAAERRIARLEEDARKEERWLEDAKRARGYDIGVSFDTVWVETCAKADGNIGAVAEVERGRCANLCEERAAYFDRAPGHRDWKDAARSYRATAQEIRDLKPAALLTALIAREDDHDR
ncbi:hypothetical protein ACQVP2_35330 [Methylobacterium aquaticum]|uniref:hypothetical protein n=1 Tax=Methylobacterium aquaticum TaxID=270351 RepID=UPI003D167D49